MRAFRFSIRRSVIYLFILVGVLSTLSISVLWITTEFSEHQARIIQYRESSLKAHKFVLKHEVERVLSYIDFSRKQNTLLSEQELKNNLLNYIASQHFEHGGYVFVNTYDGKALVFDGKRIFGDKDISNLTDPDGLPLFDLEIQATKKPEGDYMFYRFKRMDTTYIEQKISYIRGYDDWGWIVGAGLYLNNTLNEIKNAEADYQKKLNSRIIKISLLFGVLFIVLLIFGYYLSRYIEKDFTVFTRFFNAASATEARIEPKDLKVNEFIKLAKTANEMIDKRILDRRQIIEQRNTMQKYLDIVGVIVLALDTKGQVTLINKKGCEILGYHESELLGKNWIDNCIPEEESVRIKQIFEKKISNSEDISEKSINPVRTKSGAQRTIEWHNMLIFDDNNSITGILSSGIDVTEKLKSQQDLMESENKYRRLFEKTSDPVSILDTRMQFTDCNNASLKFFGAHGLNELKGKSLKDFALHQKDMETHTILEQKTKEAILMGYSRFDWQHQNLAGNKCYSDVSLTLIPISGENKIHMVIRDVQLRAEYEQRLREAAEKAERGDKLKTTFLNNMSHEVRTPLNTIMGFSQLLSQENLPKKDIQSFTNSIINSGETLTRIMDDIMDFSRYQAGELITTTGKTNLKQIMREVFIENSPLIARKPIDFRFSIPFPATHFIVQSDGKRLKQVLTHLVGNAMKFTDEGMVKFGFECREKDIIFHVSDTGIGIENQFRDSIFGKFNQIEHVSIGKIYGGTGLGLSISKAIVESLGGHIWMEPNPPGGSSFFFTIPYLPMDYSNEIKSTVDDQGQQVSLIYVTKDPRQYAEFHRMVTPLGFTPVHMDDSTKTLDFCRQSEHIRAVFYDVNDLTKSKDFVASLKRFFPQLFCVAVVNNTPGTMKEEALSLGYHDFVYKPFNNQDVLCTIENIIDRKRKRRK